MLFTHLHCLAVLLTLSSQSTANQGNGNLLIISHQCDQIIENYLHCLDPVDRAHKMKMTRVLIPRSNQGHLSVIGLFESHLKVA